MGLDQASVDAPSGFDPYGPVLRANYYAVKTSNVAEMNVGDMVKHTGTTLATPKHGQLVAASVMTTGAANVGLGAIMACFDSNFDPVDRIASSTTGNSTIAGYVLVADHPQQLFIGQEDGTTSSLVAANVGLNISISDGGTPAASNGYKSTAEIDSNTVATTATLALKLINIHPNDSISGAGAAGNHARFIVQVNSHFYGDNKLGI